MPSALIRPSPLFMYERYPLLPRRIAIPGAEIYGAEIGWTSDDGNYRLVNLVEVKVGPAGNQFAVHLQTEMTLQGDTLTITDTYELRNPTKPELLAYAAAKRSQKSQSGTMLGQVPIPTDLDTRSILQGAYAKSLATPAFTMKWRDQTGAAMTLTATQIQNAAQQVGQFLGACINAEIDAIVGINGNTITTTDQIDALFAGIT